MDIEGIAQGMAYSDIPVLQALRTLVDQHGTEEVISYAMICEYSGVALNTAIRSLRRLQARRQIDATLTPRGYTYRVLDDDRQLSRTG